MLEHQSKKKISIITVVLNRENTIGIAIKSLNDQDYEYIEHIIVDGGSTDGTLKIIQSMRRSNSVILSEKDAGIYDALNKGILLSTGDIIGILHSDDYYPHPRVISSVMSYFNDSEIDAVYGDAIFFNLKGKVVRYFSSQRFSVEKMKYGEMMAHTALFLNKRIFNKYGLYKTSYEIAGDFEFVARVFNQKNVNFKYIKEVFVKMKLGGKSNISILNRIKTNIEMKNACAENFISTNYIKLSLRYFHKIFEFLYLNNTDKRN